MLGTLKALPEAVKSWRDNGDQFYQTTSGAIAVLAVTSVVSGSRPSLLVASLMDFLGLGSVARWLGADAPPFLALQDTQVQVIAMKSILCLLTIMVVVPVYRGRNQRDGDVHDRPWRLIGARSAATVWLLLLVAAQHGPVGPVLLEWYDLARAAGLVVTATVAGGLLLHLIVGDGAIGGLVRMLLQGAFHCVYRLLVGLAFAAFAIVSCAISLPISAVAWFAALEADHGSDTRLERASSQGEGISQPTGAIAATSSANGPT